MSDKIESGWKIRYVYVPTGVSPSIWTEEREREIRENRNRFPFGCVEAVDYDDMLYKIEKQRDRIGELERKLSELAKQT